ncbi:MtnX-like HAD-IB family phosphatase [Mangrovibacillus cuniculi]|uniref:2-hydroxy-3-keto-5-methylthiopentenyl-1-phosphate phosphatase n=1 Tax=Mangrovibacillus cuniculi TaxID=2593652 RepID=A0A7S8CA27_9BACI|nr:MtnX-like HAD-IB family phosphatase [Mangrovibacillus cuniculi]QPC46137.1 MtnX-like HAD-IB family phosphatase [Mangrovibacillus cuniculi]
MGINNVQIFSDFDGTITLKDTIALIMERFAPPEWNELKDAVLSQQMPIEEGVGRMFAFLPSDSLEEIKNYAIEKSVIREGFGTFLTYCQEENIPFHVVSGGMGFFIEPILAPYLNMIDSISCNSITEKKERLHVLWPYPCEEECIGGCGCCKPAVIKQKKDAEAFTVLIGDSVTDIKAAHKVDLVFARGSLGKYCEEHKIPYLPYETFLDCLHHLKTVKEGVHS